MSTNRSNRVWKHLKRFIALAIVALLIGPLMSAGPPEVDLTLRYLLLATSRTKTMQKELDEAAARGFRLLPSTMISKSQTFGGVEIVVVLEKEPRSEENYKYLLLATSKTSTLQKEMSEAISQGWKVVGMVSRGEHIVILEQRNP